MSKIGPRDVREASEDREVVGAADVVATVGTAAIRVADVDARDEAYRRSPGGARLAAPGTPEAERFRRWVADALITEELIAQELLARGLDDDEACRDRLVGAVTADVRASRADVGAYHAANHDRFTRPERRRVRHLLVATEADARRHLDEVAGGTDLATVAAHHSEDAGSRHRRGDLGWVARGDLAGPLGEAIFGARVGELVGPVATSFGWHVVRVEDVDPGGPVPLDEVAASIERELTRAARREAFDRWLAARRREVVRRAPEWRHPGDPRSPHHTHRH